MYPNEIENIKQAESFIQDNPAILFYFYNNHCAPCQSLRPKVIELICDRYPKLKMMFVDSEKYPEVAAYFNSFSNPTLIIYFDGKEHRRVSKYVGIPQLSEEIKKPYFLLFDE